ncbi:MAG: NAD(P)-dependent oxidoreductase [Saprospiraceae bacterium]|nr:NAD(P)-dependent oxidoreductase [Saprospiraceae bacterium]
MTPENLEEKLCTPSERLINDFKKVQGNILILGLGGKMGPSLGKLARNAAEAAGSDIQVMGASRFSNADLRSEMETYGIRTFAGDLLDDTFLQRLPDVENIIYMAGQKFGTDGAESYTWAMNTFLPGMVADRYRNSNIVAFSTGNVYPFVSVKGQGATEKTNLSPLGEYAQSCLGRERIFEYFAKKNNTPTLIYRLNYALDLHYGVLNDIALSVKHGNPLSLDMGFANVIWQGDANEYAIRSLLHCQVPAKPLNVTGPQVLSVEKLARTFAEKFGTTPNFEGQPKETALLSDASHAYELFGKPLVSIDQMIDWTVDWINSGGKQLGKPTHFQERKGNF